MRPLRRRVPPSDFRQFTCRKSMEFSGVPAKPVLWGIRPLSTGGKWTERPPGGLYTKGEMPPGAPRSPIYRMPSSAPQPRVCRGASLFPFGGTADERHIPAPLAPSEGSARRHIPAPWLPLTRELSPQATEGENSQSVCSAHPASLQARLISPSVKPFGLATSLVRGRQGEKDGRRKAVRSKGFGRRAPRL